MIKKVNILLQVQDVEWVVDRVTGNRKGFCFVIFTDPESVEVVTDGKIPPQSQKHEIKVSLGMEDNLNSYFSSRIKEMGSSLERPRRNFIENLLFFDDNIT